MLLFVAHNLLDVHAWLCIAVAGVQYRRATWHSQPAEEDYLAGQSYVAVRRESLGSSSLLSMRFERMQQLNRTAGIVLQYRRVFLYPQPVGTGSLAAQSCVAVRHRGAGIGVQYERSIWDLGLLRGH